MIFGRDGAEVFVYMQVLIRMNFARCVLVFLVVHVDKMVLSSRSHFAC